MQREEIFIGGSWAPRTGTVDIEGISPHTGEVISRVPEASAADIDRAVAAARAAFDDGPWSRTSPSERADVLRALGKAIEARGPAFADASTAEVGTPTNVSLMIQVMPARFTIDSYADLLEQYPFEEDRPGLLGTCRVVQAPVGVCAGIVPWNVPLSQMATKLAGCLASGSTMILKAAPETPQAAYLFAEVVEDLDLPEGVVSVLVAGRELSEALVRHPGIDKVAFTGSTATGSRIGAICGEQIKRCTLELGGKSAAIVLDDADIESVVPQLLPVAFVNNGQTCAAQTRAIVPRPMLAAITDAMAAHIATMTVGAPTDPATHVGPLVTERQRERVEGFIRSGVDQGARLVCGGGRPADLDRGWYVEPTLFTDVDNSMTIAREEIFGPVLSVIPYDDVDDAVRIANDSDYGLSGTVWGADNARCEAVARRVRTGVVAINSGLVGDVKNPFGGFKRSGIGREMGREGLEAYLEPQTLVLPPGAE